MLKTRASIMTESEYPKLMQHSKDGTIFLTYIPGHVTVVDVPEGSTWELGKMYSNFNMQYLEDFKGTVEITQS